MERTAVVIVSDCFALSILTFSGYSPDNLQTEELGTQKVRLSPYHPPRRHAKIGSHLIPEELDESEGSIA